MENNQERNRDFDDAKGNHLLPDSESKFFLASIINTLQDSIVTINLEGIITSWNSGAERLYGYRATEVLGRSLKLVLLPEDFAPLLKKIERIKAGEIVPTYDTIRLDKAGESLNLEVTLSPVQNDLGRVIGISTVARDVTALRHSEEALAASENQLRAIVQAATDFAIITLDLHGKIIDWNSGAERIFGYTSHEVIGRHTDIIFTPEDVAGGIPQVEIETAASTGRSIDERWHLRKDGTRFFMSGVMTPVTDGPFPGYVKIARNITDRKLAEEALMLSEQRKSLAVQSAGMGEWEWDIETDLVKMSDEVALLLGLPAGYTNITINALMQQVYPPDREAVAQQLKTMLEGLNIFQAEYRIVRKDNGELKWVNAYGRIVAHKGDAPRKIIGVIYDITPRKLLEKQKEDFISLASHELKTPVTAIKVYTELLEEKLAPLHADGNFALLKKLNGQVDRLIKLIQTLLDSSAVTEGKMQLKPETFDLNSAIGEQLPALQAISGTHDLEWEPSPVGVVHADRDRIIQVVTNFISNAVKYSEPGTNVIISTEDRLDGVMVKVKDFGAGIPSESKPYIFDRYYRVAGEQNRREGFGLGLYICAAIIRQHHGIIGVETNPGEGSTFYFILPYS